MTVIPALSRPWRSLWMAQGSASDDKTVPLWDIETGARMACLNGHFAAALSVKFSPDGSRLASASLGGTVPLWDGELGAHRCIAGAFQQGHDHVGALLHRHLKMRCFGYGRAKADII